MFCDCSETRLLAKIQPLKWPITHADLIRRRSEQVQNARTFFMPEWLSAVCSAQTPPHLCRSTHLGASRSTWSQKNMCRCKDIHKHQKKVASLLFSDMCWHERGIEGRVRGTKALSGPRCNKCVNLSTSKSDSDVWGFINKRLILKCFTCI